jgi:hypothetical protein
MPEVPSNYQRIEGTNRSPIPGASRVGDADPAEPASVSIRPGTVNVGPGQSGQRGMTQGGNHMAQLSGDTQCIRGLVDDGNGAVSFNVDVNADFFGSIHGGTVTCAGPVRIVNEKHQDGNGSYGSSVDGDIYTWHTQCPNFQGVRRDRGAVARRPSPPIHSLPTSSATVAMTGQSEVAS